MHDDTADNGKIPLWQDQPLSPAPYYVAPAPPIAPKPRVWTVFVAFVVALVALFAVQIVVAVALLFWIMLQGSPIQSAAEELLSWAATPEFFIIAGLPTQLTILLTALSAAWLSPQPVLQRLGLNAPRAAAWQTVAWVVGAIVPFLVGMGAAHLLALAIPPDPTVAQLYENMHWGIAAPFILFIAIAPGICEELFFRGYLQRRLTRRWGTWIGVLVSSVLFGVMHIMPHTVVFAFILGIWLGLMAWRTDSIWPSAVCHALVNGLWNVWNIGVALAVFSDEFPWLLLSAIALVGLAAFAIACWDLVTHRREMRSSDSAAIAITPAGTH